MQDLPKKRKNVHQSISFTKFYFFAHWFQFTYVTKHFMQLFYTYCVKILPIFYQFFLHILILSQIWCAHKSKIDQVSTERVFSRYYDCHCNKCHRLRLLCIKKDSNKLLLQTVENQLSILNIKINVAEYCLWWFLCL